MTSAAESFVVALGRAAKRSGRYLRGLSAADRDDVLAAALLLCWEHKATYDPAESLDEWFIDALRTARRRHKLGDHTPTTSLDTFLTAPDDTSTHAEVVQAAEAMMQSLSTRERMVVLELEDGLSWRSVMTKHRVSGQEVGEITRKLRKLKRLLPETRSLQRVIRAYAPTSDSVTEAPQSRIDYAISQMDFPPAAGADCPACWRCMYFAGWVPRSYTMRTTTPADAEVQTAIWETEKRKIQIGNST